jgi:hypothetical protein
MALTRGSILLVWSSLCITGTFGILEVTTGSCMIQSDGCVNSPNYGVGHYPANDQCTIRMTAAGCITLEAFGTEAGYDTVNARSSQTAGS